METVAPRGGARLMAGETRLEAVVFRTETRNGTMMVSDGRMSKAKNYASGLVTGLETSLQARFFRFLGTELRATLQKAENRSKAYEYYGKRLPNEPDLSIIAGISLGPFKGIEPEYWLDFKSPFFRDPGNVYRVPDDDGMPGMVFHNARITWKAGSRFGFGFSIRNFNGISLRSEEMIMSNENGYSWILYPSNEVSPGVLILKQIIILLSKLRRNLKMFSRHAFFSAVFIVLMIMTGCFLVTSDPDRTDDRLKLFIAGSDYHSGTLEWMVIEDNSSVESCIEIYSDAVLDSYNGNLYMLEKYGADNIMKFDPSKCGKSGIIYQIHLGNNWNPQDIEFLNRKKAYISNMNEPEITIFNPETGEIVSSIDISKYTYLPKIQVPVQVECSLSERSL